MFCGWKTEISYVIVGMIFQINPVEFLLAVSWSLKKSEHCQIRFAIVAQKGSNVYYNFARWIGRESL